MYLAIPTDKDEALASALSQLERAEHPVVHLNLREPYEIGADFLRWEFAIAVAGAFLGSTRLINPTFKSQRTTQSAFLDP